MLPDPQVPPSPMAPQDPALDPLFALTWAAAATTTIRLATGIVILPQRNPVVLAKQIASVDVLSGGRFTFGVGVGYLEPEFRAIGANYEERGAVTDEYLDAMTSLWYDEHPEYHGRFVDFAGIDAHPRPVQRPIPIVVGGHTRFGVPPHGHPRPRLVRLRADAGDRRRVPRRASRHAAERIERPAGARRDRDHGDATWSPDQGDRWGVRRPRRRSSGRDAAPGGGRRAAGSSTPRRRPSTASEAVSSARREYRGSHGSDPLPEDADPAEVAAHLRQYGYAIVDDLADEATMDQLAAEVAPYVEASDAGRDEYDGRFTRRTGALIARCPTVRQLVMHPTAVGVAQHLMAQATTIQLHLTQLITISPGESQQKLHRDQMAFDFYPVRRRLPRAVQHDVGVDRLHGENGATHILPGTSTMDDEAALAVPDGAGDDARGSCLFYEGKVLHGGGANRSDGDRRGVNITYAVGWVRQEENQYLATPPEIARTLDDDLLRMMGYQQGAFALGYVGDQEDPLAHLRGEPRQGEGDRRDGATQRRHPHLRRRTGLRQLSDQIERATRRPSRIASCTVRGATQSPAR